MKRPTAIGWFALLWLLALVIMAATRHNLAAAFTFGLCTACLAALLRDRTSWRA